MIRHIVMWKLAATDPAERAEAAAIITRELTGLVPLIPEIGTLEVRSNEGYFDVNFDLVLIAEYATWADLEAYQVHPEHQRVVPIVRANVSARASVDFEV